MIFVSLGAFELKQLIGEGIKYFYSLWNLNDMLLFSTGLTIPIIEGIYMRNLRQDLDLSSEIMDYNLQWIRILTVCAIISSFIKILNVAQIHPEIAFLINVMYRILCDSAPFFCFLGFYYVSFAFAFHATSMTFNTGDPAYGYYEGIESSFFIPYFLYAFRSSIGDSNTYGMSALPPALIYTTWALWFILVFFGYPFLLNFLITIININYCREAAVKVEESYHKKV